MGLYYNLSQDVESLGLGQSSLLNVIHGHTFKHITSFSVNFNIVSFEHIHTQSQVLSFAIYRNTVINVRINYAYYITHAIEQLLPAQLADLLAWPLKMVPCELEFEMVSYGVSQIFD